MGRIGFNNEFDVLDNYKLSHVQSGITTDRRELNEVKCRLAEGSAPPSSFQLLSSSVVRLPSSVSGLPSSVFGLWSLVFRL